MTQTSTILNAVVPVCGVMGLGVFIRKLNWLTEEADNSLMRVCVNVLLPWGVTGSAAQLNDQ